MNRPQKFWLGALGLSAVGFSACLVSATGTKVTIALTPGATQSFNEFRLFGGSVFAGELRYETTPQLRAAEGGYPARGDWRKLGYLEYANPGEPIVLRVSVTGTSSSTVFHAMPTGWLGGGNRDLTTAHPIQVGDARRFPWPPPPAIEGLNVPMGRSQIDVTVLDVGPTFQGQTVTLIVRSPIDSSMHPHIGWSMLRLFYLTPFYLLVLVIWAGVLVVRQDPP